MNNQNISKTLKAVCVLSCFIVSFQSHAFLQGLQKSLSNIGQQMQTTKTDNSKPATGSVDTICIRVFGAPYEGTLPAGTSPEQIVSKYFKHSIEMTQQLNAGISKKRSLVMPNIEHMIRDLNDTEVRRLAEAFIRNPTEVNLAFIVNMAERGDGYAPENRPSQQTEARTLLGLVILQYPELALNPGHAAVIFRENFIRNSGLSTAMLARMHLFGEGLPKDIRAFSNYVGQASSNYQVHINDYTILYALDNIPDWSQAQQYSSLLQSSKDMMESLNRSQNASAAAPNIRRNALELMSKGEEIDYMTLEALGAAPLIAEFRARGQRMKSEDTGENNLIKIAVDSSEKYKEASNKLLSTSPKLSDDALSKLAEANRMRLENVNELYKLTGQVALLFFNGNISETQEIGGYINTYFRNSCESTFRSIEFARESGVPKPTTNIDRSSELFN